MNYIRDEIQRELTKILSADKEEYIDKTIVRELKRKMIDEKLAKFRELD